jgi:exodeoxyribonuclease V alpha subunit
MDGDTYQRWVAGYDVDTGVAKGRLVAGPKGVRFAEVVVNGPKTWSLAAALDPEISAAYDAAQTRAAEQIIGWVAQQATTRVGPRDKQVQVPVERIEAAVIAHHTSRTGDPHRHLHLQVNARVFAEEKWRGLHTVGVRDTFAALNGIGHAAVMCDPEFRRCSCPAWFHPGCERRDQRARVLHGCVQCPVGPGRPQHRALRSRARSATCYAESAGY